MWINCSSDLKIIENWWPAAANFKSFSRLRKQFFLTVSQNNFGNKLPFSNLSIFVFLNFWSTTLVPFRNSFVEGLSIKVQILISYEAPSVVWKNCSPFLGGNLLVDEVLSLKMVSGGLNHDSKLPFFKKSLCSLVLIGLLRGSLESECVQPQGVCKTFCWCLERIHTGKQKFIYRVLWHFCQFN